MVVYDAGGVGHEVPEGLPHQRAKPKLLMFDCVVKGFLEPLKLLIDCGATENFVRRDTVQRDSLLAARVVHAPERFAVRLATGQLVQMNKKSYIDLSLNFSGFECDIRFVVLDMDDRYDLILGMPWLTMHEPCIDWRSRQIYPSVALKEPLPVVWNAISDREEDPQVCIVNASLEMTSSGRGTIDDRLVDEALLSGAKRDVPRKGETNSVSRHPALDAEDGLATRSANEEVLLEKRALSASSSNGLINHDELDRNVVADDLPCTAEGIVNLPPMEWEEFLNYLKAGDVDDIAVPTAYDCELNSSSNADESVLESDRQSRYNQQGWEALRDNPVYPLLREFADVFPDETPSGKPLSKGITHDIDLEPGTKYCVTRQWPLPKEQVDYIDEFFEKKLASGLVRESKSPHTSPTFCVRKPTGGWRVVHAYNKLNAATIPSQTPIPRKDVIINGMAGSKIFSAIDLRDGFYQILMRESDIPLTAVSTPSGMLWEWLVMPQGLKNAPATFNRLVQNAMRSHRAYAPCYFDDIFVHSNAVEDHLKHLRAVFQTMREYKLYSNLKKCLFCLTEIPVLGCYVGAKGVRVDHEKVKAVSDWPVPTDVKSLRKWLGLANYMHRYAKGYAQMAKPLTDLLRKDAGWDWSTHCQAAFDAIKQSLLQAPILALPDYTRSFQVVCDASDFAIGCALLQQDSESRTRVISYQSRQLKAAELNYPVHDKELLAIKYALLKFRVHLLGGKPFVVYTDHASLRTAVNSPHLSQRMARWLAFFAEYDFKVEYKPGKENILADALSRRPDLEAAVQTVRRNATDDSVIDLNAVSVSILTNNLSEDIQAAYKADSFCSAMIAHLQNPSAPTTANILARASRFSFSEGLLWHQVSPGDVLTTVVPNDSSLRERILREYHDVPYAGHLGREKTYVAVSRHFWWKHLIKWVTTYVKTCEVCQRVKPAQSTQAPLRPLPIPSECWQSMTMDFAFGYPPDLHGNTGVVVFVDPLSKMVHLAPCKASIDARGTAELFLAHVFRYHGLPKRIISDRDPRFTAQFWQCLFQVLGTQLSMSTTDHPETDGQSERVIRVVEDVIRSLCDAQPTKWSDLLVFVEFALNNSIHASTGYSPFYVNGLRAPHVPSSLLIGDVPTLSGGGTRLTEPSQIDDLNEISAASQPHGLDCNANGVFPTQFKNDKVSETQTQETKCVPHTQVFVHHPSDPKLDSSLNTTQEKYDTNKNLFQEITLSPMTTCKQEEVAVLTADQVLREENDNERKSATRAQQRHIRETEKQIQDFVALRAFTLGLVRDHIAASKDLQKQNADRRGRKLKVTFKVGDQVLLSTKNLPADAVSELGSTKLLPRWIGPFKVIKCVNDVSYKLETPQHRRFHSTFYVGRLKPYLDPSQSPLDALCEDDEQRSLLDNETSVDPQSVAEQRLPFAVSQQEPFQASLEPQPSSPHRRPTTQNPQHSVHQTATQQPPSHSEKHSLRSFASHRRQTTRRHQSEDASTSADRNATSPTAVQQRTRPRIATHSAPRALCLQRQTESPQVPGTE